MHISPWAMVSFHLIQRHSMQCYLKTLIYTRKKWPCCDEHWLLLHPLLSRTAAPSISSSPSSSADPIWFRRYRFLRTFCCAFLGVILNPSRKEKVNSPTLFRPWAQIICQATLSIDIQEPERELCWKREATTTGLWLALMHVKQNNSKKQTGIWTWPRVRRCGFMC